MTNFILIGTSHIAQQSIQEITQTIETQKPDLIAIELDSQRLRGLLSNKKSKITLSLIRQIGFKGYLFALVGSFLQKKLGKLVGIDPGAEMLAAVKLAKKHKIPLALIDQNITITLKRFSQTFSWKEKYHLVVDIFKGFFFKKKQLAKLGKDFDLSKVPSKKVIKLLISELKQRYPNIYRVLVHERNQVMIHNLKILFNENPEKTILAIVGAGHEEAIQKAFKSKII